MMRMNNHFYLSSMIQCIPRLTFTTGKREGSRNGIRALNEMPPTVRQARRTNGHGDQRVCRFGSVGQQRWLVLCIARDLLMQMLISWLSRQRINFYRLQSLHGHACCNESMEGWWSFAPSECARARKLDSLVSLFVGCLARSLLVFVSCANEQCRGRLFSSVGRSTTCAPRYRS